MKKEAGLIVTMLYPRFGGHFIYGLAVSFDVGICLVLPMDRVFLIHSQNLHSL
jgi:hypothetical protein